MDKAAVTRFIAAATALLAAAAHGQDAVDGPAGRPEGGAMMQESYSIRGGDILIRQTAQGAGDLVLPPSVALALKYGLKIRVEDASGRELKLVDLGRPTRHGPTMRVEAGGLPAGVRLLSPDRLARRRQPASAAARRSPHRTSRFHCISRGSDSPPKCPRRLGSSRSPIGSTSACSP